MRKVELAQALSCRAGLLVLDEPWTGLDQTACGALHELLGAAGSALLVADHSGQAAAIAAVRLVRFVDGVLAAADPPSPVTVVELRCPGDPRAVLHALPPVLDQVVTDGTLTVRVPVEHGDALLAAALALRCSVVAVHREGGA